MGLLFAAAGAAATLPTSGHYIAYASVLRAIPVGQVPCAAAAGDTYQGELALTTVTEKLQLVLRVPTASGIMKQKFQQSGGNRLNPSGTVESSVEGGGDVQSYGYVASYIPLDANSFTGRFQVSQPTCTVFSQLVFIRSGAD